MAVQVTMQRAVTGTCLHFGPVFEAAALNVPNTRPALHICCVCVLHTAEGPLKTKEAALHDQARALVAFGEYEC